MKMMIVVCLALVAAAAAAPAAPSATEVPVILRSDIQQDPEGPYEINVETSNGIVQNEKGELKEALDEENKPHKVIVVRGSYSYTGPDGTPVRIEYYADETGFHAEGDSIPKAPVAARR